MISFGDLFMVLRIILFDYNMLVQFWKKQYTWCRKQDVKMSAMNSLCISLIQCTYIYKSMSMCNRKANITFLNSFKPTSRHS